MKQSLRKWLVLLLAAVYIGSTGYYVVFRILSSRQARQVEALAQYVVQAPSQTVSETVPETVPVETTTAETAQTLAPELEVQESGGKNLERFSALLEKNRNFTAWLSWGGNDGYPVMYSPGDPDFYLNHSFEGDSSFVGVPYLDSRCTVSSNSLMIYGHNMKNGSMFAGIMKYENQEYADQNPYIQLDTLDENRIYRVIGAFYGGVYYADEEGVFRFYNYAGDLSRDMFRDYTAEVQLASIIETGETAEYGDELLTLVTCAYQRKNGRFVVVAKRVE